MAGDAATNAASKVKPSQDALSQIDHPAEDNTWHDAPSFSKENVKSQINKFYKGDAAQDAKSMASETEQVARNPDGTLDTQAAANSFAQKIDAKIPDETQDAAKKQAAVYRQKTRDYLNKKMPRERREQTIWRLKVSA
jgi:hypothetical protein